jgi:hypothetical protein
MSASTGRTTRNGSPPTRQQLDELDALLKKMLELPVQQVDEATIPPPPVIPPRPVSSGSETGEGLGIYSPGYTVVETPEAPSDGGSLPGDPVQEQAAARLREAEEWQQYQTSWQPSAQTWAPLAETWRQTQSPVETGFSAYGNPLAESAVPPPPLPVPNLPSVQTQTVEIQEPAGSPVAVPETSATLPSPPTELPRGNRGYPLIAWPIVGVNVLFDVPTYALGPLGRWLRGPEGGGWLAFLGMLGFVGAALVVVLDGIGWNW